MQYYSTNKKVPPVSFEEAVFQGLPEDNGLYNPAHIPSFTPSFIKDLKNRSRQEIGLEVAKMFIEHELPETVLQEIVSDTLSFELPLASVKQGIFALELYHGPTCAFKDVGARFLARCMGYFTERRGSESTILVATSGDTGGAVAHGFLNVSGVRVILLYPKGKVSAIQEAQLTSLGANITALQVEGTFDDCQALVKKAFLDKAFKRKFNLTSANSINVARLIPQSFYYFHAVSQLETSSPVYVAVPSGNYGNLTAGLMAKKMGLPIARFIAAANANKAFPDYLSSGLFEPRPSIQTISNAMDVGNPSNFQRIYNMYNGDIDAIRRDIAGFTYTDKQTREAISLVMKEYGYLLDPHGAVGYLGVHEFLKDKNGVGIFLETAHPAKFGDIVSESTEQSVIFPERLSNLLNKERNCVPLPVDYNRLKEIVTEVVR